MHYLFRGDDRRRMRAIAALAAECGVPIVAVNDCTYHVPERRPLQDVVTSIREGKTITQAGFLLHANSERHLKPALEMALLFKDYPQAIAATQDIVALCNFSLDELKYNYPNESVPQGKTAQNYLADLVTKGVADRFNGPAPDRIMQLINKELALIDELGYAHYFLTVYDIVAFARSKGILCQGRGSAANSAVCYYLGVTAVDPANSALLFERFLSRERKEPPDIDVDFEHERREEVIQYIYQRYGRHRAAIAATVITYRPRSAVREVGKVMGLSEDVTSALASTVWGSWGTDIPADQLKETGLDVTDPLLKMTIDLTRQLLGFPRHLSQHVGGFVLTEDPLEELVPIGNAAMEDRTFIEWDKDDIDELKILKVDVLALGMLTCIAKCFAEIKRHYGQSLTLANINQEDDQVYEMIQRADTLGVFQIESRAQMNMLPRLKPKTFYDLVIEVAIVRPGPIQGDMVHPYLRRRDGIEAVVYPYPTKFPDKKDELRNILGRTLGVPLFQEQAMQMAIDAAEFSPEEANKLRRAMATFRNVGTIHLLQEKMVSRMIARGYDPVFAAQCFEQIKGFGSYGFPESHAASFAQLVYVSCWLKHYFPDAFCAALLNSQPMGFYAPAQLVRDAIEHGVEVRPADVSFSEWNNILEVRAAGDQAIRLGFRQVDGFRQAWADAIVAARTDAGFSSIEDLARRAALPPPALRKLADADAMGILAKGRRDALWEARRTPPDQLPLFSAMDAPELGIESDAKLPAMPLAEEVVADYQMTRLSLKAHPLQFLRARLTAKGVLSCAQTISAKDGQKVCTAGIVLIRQRPGKGNAVFITIEDESGIVNILLWARDMEKQRRAVMAARLMIVEGEIQRSKENVVHLMASRIIDATAMLDQLSDEPTLESSLAHADEVRRPQAPRQSGHPRNVRILPKSRDFH